MAELLRRWFGRDDVARLAFYHKMVEKCTTPQQVHTVNLLVLEYKTRR